jgi:hypothetical protein
MAQTAIAGSQEPTRTQVTLQQEPVLGVTTQVEQSGDISAEATEDVRQQREGYTFENYMATASDEDYMSMSAMKAQADAGDDEAYMSMMARLAPTAQPGQTVQPFTREGQTVVPANIVDPYKVNKAELLAEQKQKLNAFLLDKVPDERVRQILTDNMSAGDFSDILGERLAEQGRGAGQLAATVVGKSPINTAAKYAFFAYQDYMNGRSDSFGAAYSAYSPQIKAESEQKLNSIASVMSGPTLGRAAQNGIKRILDKKLVDEEITQQEYDSIVFDEEGREKRFLSDEDAQATLSYSFDQMSTSQKFGVIALENVVTLAGFGAGKAAAGTATLKRVTSLKEEYADLVVKGQKIGDVEDITEVAKLLQIAGKVGSNPVSRKLQKINMTNLEIGIKQQRLDKTLQRAADENGVLGAQLDAMKRAGVTKVDPDYVILKNQYEASSSRILRATFSGRTLPLVAENAQNALIISAGQLASREWLPGATGLDADTSEMIGALAMGVGGYKVVTKVGAPLGRAVTRPFDLDRMSVKNAMGRTFDYIAYVATGGVAKSLFTDDSIRRFEAATGKTLTPSQLKGVRYATRLIQNMDDEDMELVVKAADDYLDLQDRIVSRFPEAMQAQATEAFTLSFAEATAIGPLAGLSRLSQGKVDVRDLSNLGDVTAFQLAQEAQLTRTELALDNLAELAGGIDDTTNKQRVLDFVRDGKAALRENKNTLNIEAEQNIAYLDSLETAIFDDLSVDIPDGTFEKLFLARKASHERLGRAFDSKAEIIRLQETFEDGLATRMEAVSGFRGKPEHEQVLRAETESFINVHMDVIKARGSLVYENVVAFSEGRNPIDISPLIKQTLQDMDISDIKTFFAAEGEFFNGKLGRQAFEVMENMMKRVVPAEQMGEMRSLLKQADEYKGAESLVDELSDLEVALRIDDSSDTLSMFAQANPYEIDVMRRSFRDYAFQLKDRNPELALQYRKFEKKIDGLIKSQDPDMFDMLENAREVYKSEVGDRLRSGSFLNKLDKSQQNKLVTAENGMKYRYSNVDPVSVFDPITTNIDAVVSGGKRGEAAKRKIAKHLQNIMIDFGERTPNGNLFDLSNPASKANFDALSALMKERAYADWAAETVNKLQRKSGDIRTRGLGERLSGYDFERGKGWDEVQDAFMVKVIDENGNQSTRSLINLDELISQENSIEKLIETNAEAKRLYTDFAKEVKDTDSQLRREINNNVSYEQTAFDELKDILDTNPDSFFTKFIEQGTAENIDSLRDLSVGALVRSGRSQDEAAAMFDMSVKSLVSRALLAKSKVNPVAGSTIAAVKSKKKFAQQVSDPQVMLKSIDDNREVLTQVLGEEHVGYLEDIADFINKAEPARTYTMNGVIRPYGMNEGLSRVYNIARGMVSPLYVTSEFAVRLASQANIEILQLAGQNQEAARIITNMMRYPELVTRKDMDLFSTTMKEFVVTELTKTGADPSMFFPETEDENEQ